MNQRDFKERTKKFALAVIKLVDNLQRNRTVDVIGRQLIKSGTSVAANYRSACRAKSKADFISKMGIVEEEADESLFWMELLIEAGFLNQSEASPLMDEANQISAMVVASIKTARFSAHENPRSAVPSHQ